HQPKTTMVLEDPRKQEFLWWFLHEQLIIITYKRQLKTTVVLEDPQKQEFLWLFVCTTY
ncbi:13934_t:CDS:1, partial [Cetraspora pellucida]